MNRLSVPDAPSLFSLCPQRYSTPKLSFLYGFQIISAVVFALFIGFGITPLLIYYINMIVPSLRVTIFLVIALTYATAAFMVWKTKK